MFNSTQPDTGEGNNSEAQFESPMQSSLGVFGQESLLGRQMGIYPGLESMVVMSNVQDVLQSTGNAGAGIIGAGAYDGRGMYFIVPSNVEGYEKRVRYLMAPITNIAAEVDHYRSMLSMAGIEDDLFEVHVLTEEGAVPYDSLPDGPENVEIDEDTRAEVIRDFVLEQEPHYLHLMMTTETIQGRNHNRWREGGIDLSSAATTIDKAMGKYILSQNGEHYLVPNNGIVAPGAVIMHPDKVDQALQVFPENGLDNLPQMRDLEIADVSPNIILKLDLEDVDGSVDNILALIDANLEEHEALYIKHGAGHSGTSNLPVEVGYDDEYVRNYLYEAIEYGENIIIEKNIARMQDSDCGLDEGLELGVRAYLNRNGDLVITSLHRQIVSGDGLYEGQILAVDGARLSDNPRFATAANLAIENTEFIARAYADYGYTDGPVNIDFMLEDDPNQGTAKAVATDLNNLREGGSSASSNVLALGHEIAQRGYAFLRADAFGDISPELSEVEGIRVVDGLFDPSGTDPESLGLFDKDYAVFGNPSQGQSWEDVINALQDAGVIPYSTSTLRLEADAGDRKLKLMAYFDFDHLSNVAESQRFQYVDNVIIERANAVLEDFELVLHQTH